MSLFVGDNEDLLDEWQEERMYDEDLLIDIEKDDRLLAAVTSLYPAFQLVKACGCGARWDREGWEKLRVVGIQYTDADEDGPAESLELRDCAMCGSTLSVKK